MMLALIFSREVRPFIIAAALAVACFAAALWLIAEGGKRAVSKIDKANQSNMIKADDAERGVLTCPPGMWDKRTATCATKLH